MRNKNFFRKSETFLEKDFSIRYKPNKMAKNLHIRRKRKWQKQ